MRRLDPSVTAGGEAGPARCPYCGGTNTEREHPKGPSLCRSIHYCEDCGEPFEAMA
ncbi:1,2-phenylacetyl-CoA epoxidase subunit PaaE [Halomarina halobia]|uniref:1,2-phenylacetyl-CoA epoxidase subunit PaaE n=1 Tax=Halomarina halobia TaxID=3033386 RepID=A0ABD6AB43_9EURY|nr:1,2-phenylacetyl-CoA epoxidase subunit PaaE [Halomarina sp. PSR21]